MVAPADGRLSFHELRRPLQSLLALAPACFLSDNFTAFCIRREGY